MTAIIQDVYWGPGIELIKLNVISLLNQISHSLSNNDKYEQ